MRIKLSLRSPSKSILPVNYQYPLFSAIYKILDSASPEYAEFLHDRGYLGKDGKPRKLFCFSFLLFRPRIKPRGKYFFIYPDIKTNLIICSPMLEDFIQNFVTGLFNNQNIEIIFSDFRTVFNIDQVETVKEPDFQDTMRFKALSPIVLSTQIDTENSLKTYYYRAMDEGISNAVKQSLIRKHETIYGKPPENAELHFEVDTDYIKKKGGQEQVSKLITLRQGRHDETRVKGFLAPFTLNGSVELMRTAWECGLGDKCSMGFGCIDLL